MRLFDLVKHHTGSFFQDVPVIIADTIAAQIDRLPDGDTPPAASYGICAPPFPQFFVEARTTAANHAIERGLLCSDITDSLDDALSAYRFMVPDAHWIIQMDGYMRMNNGPLLSFAGHLWTHISSDGRILDNTEQMLVGEWTHDKWRGQPNILPPAHMVNFYPFVMKAINALHQRCEVVHMQPTRQQRRQAQRKHGLQDLTSYYVLKVKPVPKRYSFGDVAQPQPATGKREHQVRGHFRYYSPERPLFGRKSGMVWIPAHQRGEDTIGKIRKDYEVDNGGQTDEHLETAV